MITTTNHNDDKVFTLKLNTGDAKEIAADIIIDDSKGPLKRITAYAKAILLQHHNKM